MAGRKIIAYNYTITAGADERKTVYTVKEPHIKLKRWVFISEAGALGQIFGSIYYGDMKIIPEEGELSTDKFVLDTNTDHDFYRGDDVVIRFRNTSTNDLPVFGFLEFEIKEG